MRQLLRYFCGPRVLRNASNIDPPNLFDRFAAQPGEVAICATLVRLHTDVYFCTILDPLVINIRILLFSSSMLLNHFTNFSALRGLDR